MNKQATPVLIDTHVLLWSLILPEQLTDAAKTRISDSLANNALLISSISL